MGLRLQGVFYSERDNQFAINIYDSNWTNPAIEMRASAFTIEYQGDGEGVASPVIGSQAKLGLIVDSQDLQDFIDDLVTTEEGDIVMNVQYSDLNGIYCNWTGYILADLVSIPDLPLDLGYIASITATDGLGVLKGIEYRPLGGPYIGFSTFTEIILKCLNKLTGFDGIIDGFDANYKFLRVVCNWHEDSYTYASTINPLSRARVSENAFYWVDSKGNYRYRSCYDVLSDIAKAWRARMFFSGTSFYFVQANEMISPTSKTVFAITKTGSETVETAQNFTRTNDPSNNNGKDLIRLSGGTFSHFAPIRKLTVDYLHVQARNILSGQFFTQNTSAYTDFGFVTEIGQGITLAFASTLKYSVDRNPFTGVAYFIQFRLKMQVGGNAHLKGGVGATEWTSDANDWYYLTAERIDQEMATVVIRIEFVTPPLPINTTGQVLFNFQAYKAFDELGNELTLLTSGGEVTYSFVLGPSYLEVLQTGNFDGQSDTYRYAAENNKNASKDVKIEVKIGDGPSQVSPGAVQVMNNSATWVQSDNWRVGNSGAYREMGKLLTYETMRTQVLPMQILSSSPFVNNASAARFYLPHHVISYASAYWLFLGGSFDFYREISTLDLARLQSDTDFTELARELILEDEKDVNSTARSSLRSGGIGYPIAAPSTLPGIRAVNVFKQEFLDMYSAVLTITRNSGVLPANEAQIQVYQNQGLLIDLQWAKTGTGEITIDAATHYDSANYTVIFSYIE